MKHGLVALGDSITYGHGGMQSGLGSQSWAQWLAEAMDLPFTRYAVNGAIAGDVVGHQLSRLTRDYDVGCLYVGVNDVRALDWDPSVYASSLDHAMGVLASRCDRTVALTLPLALGIPRAGAKVEEANELIEELAPAHDILVTDLRDFSGSRWVWADHVHATAIGQVEIADRVARTLGAPLPSQTVVDVPNPDAWYRFHYAKRGLRERARAALFRARR